MPATATSASASGHAMPVNDDMLEAFMRFPAPLAMLDLDGHVELANSRFMEHFGPDRLDTAGLVSQVPKGLATWQPINLAPQDLHRAGLRARAIRTSGRILLMIDDSAAPQLRSELDELHGRIDTLERLAATDHLTGAWNRAHLDRVIESELARSQANRQALSLILFDIDHFKKINDRFGHAVGDSVLRELVQVVNRNIRPSDMLFRWGGEEFVVLVSAAGYRRADIVAEKLRTAVAEHRFGTAGTVTISLGVAEHAGGEDAATWFRRMDAALYEAKEAGRNRVVVSRRGDSDTWAAASGASALHLIWQEAYESGEPTIDAEHRELFRLANELIDAALPDEADRDNVKAALDSLLAHVQRHFADEEAILDRLHYAQLDVHRQAHAGLVRRAVAMATKLTAGEASLGAIVEFLAQDVVARHMMVMDRAFFPLFRKASGDIGGAVAIPCHECSPPAARRSIVSNARRISIGAVLRALTAMKCRPCPGPDRTAG